MNSVLWIDLQLFNLLKIQLGVGHKLRHAVKGGTVTIQTKEIKVYSKKNSNGGEVGNGHFLRDMINERWFIIY